MKTKSRILAGLGVVCLAMLFFFPLWKITLEAPQYPGGISLYIWIDKLSGDEPATLQNINILNHYIGMQPIEPESIPELRYFPTVVMMLMGAGVFAILLDRRPVYLGWFLVLVLLSAAGLYDFYLWEYDYGHNLSSEAPIKVPGMSYQPPLIGSKQLLNFTAISLPATGGILLGVAIIFSLCAFLRSKTRKAAPALAVLCLLVIAMAGCTVKPAAFQFGADTCNYCSMTIVDERHPAQVVVSTGKVYKFDAIECLVHFRQQHDAGNQPVSMELVADFHPPHALLPAAQAWYVRSVKLPSPMGMNLNAVASEEAAMQLKDEFGGEVYSFEALIENFKQWVP